MRTSYSILMLKSLLLAIQTMLFSLLILELAPFSSYFVKSIPELNVYMVMVAPLFLLYVLSLYLTLKGLNPAPITLTLLLVHSLTAFTYIVGLEPFFWLTILFLTILSVDLGSRLGMMRQLLPQPQQTTPAETIPAMKVYEPYLRGDMLHQPDPFNAYPYGLMVALAIIAFAGSMLVFAQQAVFVILMLGLFIFPAVLALLLLHTREDADGSTEGQEQGTQRPITWRWSANGR